MLPNFGCTHCRVKTLSSTVREHKEIEGYTHRDGWRRASDGKMDNTHLILEIDALQEALPLPVSHECWHVELRGGQPWDPSTKHDASSQWQPQNCISHWHLHPCPASPACLAPFEGPPSPGVCPFHPLAGWAPVDPLWTALAMVPSTAWPFHSRLPTGAAMRLLCYFLLFSPLLSLFLPLRSACPVSSCSPQPTSSSRTEAGRQVLTRHQVSRAGFPLRARLRASPSRPGHTPSSSCQAASQHLAQSPPTLLTTPLAPRSLRVPSALAVCAGFCSLMPLFDLQSCSFKTRQMFLLWWASETLICSLFEYRCQMTQISSFFKLV